MEDLRRRNARLARLRSALGDERSGRAVSPSRPSRGIVGATRRVLGRHLQPAQIAAIIREATDRHAALASRVPPGLNLGGRHLLDLARFTIGVHGALVESGVPADDATAWVADAIEEANRPALDWLHRAGVLRHRRPMDRLRWESRLACRFYYAAPAWEVETVPVADGHGLDIHRCAVAEFYQQLGLASLCERTICVQDERVARRYGGPAGIVFRRSGTLAGGADHCDFRYLPADAANTQPVGDSPTVREVVAPVLPSADSREAAVRRTGRIRRWVYGMPVWLFRLRLGGLLPWWVMLVTTGRRSGRRRRVVLDVIRRTDDRISVLAADGRRADWVRNLMADPRLEVWHRWRRHRALAELLDESAAAEMLLDLYHRRPAYVRAVSRVMGERVESEADVRRLAGVLQPVELTLER